MIIYACLQLPHKWPRWDAVRQALAVLVGGYRFNMRRARMTPVGYNPMLISERGPQMGMALALMIATTTYQVMA
jgi:hypothetical protein